MSMRFVRSRVWLAALAAGLVVSSWAGASASEKGKQLYVKHGCWQCHGTVGQGAQTGPKLAPEPMPQETFVSFVRTTNRAMPPYRETVLPDADLADIYAYLQSVPKAADYKSIPLLSQQ